jgi:hypothetical protein
VLATTQKNHDEDEHVIIRMGSVPFPGVRLENKNATKGCLNWAHASSEIAKKCARVLTHNSNAAEEMSELAMGIIQMIWCITPGRMRQAANCAVVLSSQIS